MGSRVASQGQGGLALVALFAAVGVTMLASWPVPLGVLGVPFAVASAWYEQLPQLPAGAEAFRVAVRPALLPLFFLSFLSVYLTTRLQGTPGRISIRSVRSKAGRVLVASEVAVLFGVLLAIFLAGSDLHPPDRRLYENDFRWDVIFLASLTVESAAFVLLATGTQRAWRRLRTRQSGGGPDPEGRSEG